MRKYSSVNLLTEGFKPDDIAKTVGNLWDTLYSQKSQAMEELKETRGYVFATSTRDTSNAKLPWKNSTTTPKICQIRDNLHSNYLSALFPNDKWLSWEAYDVEADNKDKAESIQKYMANKCRMTNFRSTVSSLLYDYLDSGNAFATTDFISRFTMDPLTGGKVKSYVGPKAVRIAPEDIVFDATAPDFEAAYKIVRSTLTLGEVARIVKDNPEDKEWAEALQKIKSLRVHSMAMRGEDVNKQMAMAVDGYGSYYDYLTSGFVEVLTFYGDMFHENDLLPDHKIVIVDRIHTVSRAPIDTYGGKAPIWHTGWRKRPDNLWAMGPLANLVGMQYRLDHLENSKADAFDLAIQPPLVVVGDVEPFEWGPKAEIHLDEGGTVTELGLNLNAIISASPEMGNIMQLMEEMAGSPKEAMGFRTPGEKTAFEVSELMTAASRIFQEKITTFEQELVEPLLNGMYEVSIRNFDGVDVIKVINDEIGAEVFRSLTKEDIAANGVIRPVGARNFAQKAQDLQNFLGVMNSPLNQILAPHIDQEGIIAFVQDILNIRNYNVFMKGAGVKGGLELQKQAALGQGENAASVSTINDLMSGQA